MIEIENSDVRKYRIYFSQNPLIAILPLNFKIWTSWVKIEIEGNTEFVDYTLETNFLEPYQYLDITVNSLKNIDRTKIKATILDYKKIINKNGIHLENRREILDFYSMRENTKVMRNFKNTSKNAAPGMVYGAFGLVVTSNLLGFSLFSLAKIFIIIEFTTILSFLNIRVDILLELFLEGIRNLTNFSLFKFPVEKIMEKVMENSIAS
jgi:hypothetical protein